MLEHRLASLFIHMTFLILGSSLASANIALLCFWFPRTQTHNDITFYFDLPASLSVFRFILAIKQHPNLLVLFNPISVSPAPTLNPTFSTDGVAIPLDSSSLAVV